MFLKHSSVLLLALVSNLAIAQDPHGSILGGSTDPSGSAIPGVQVHATNQETGITVSTTTNDAGRFRIPFLLSGTYNITAERAGFKQFVREGVQVRTGEEIEIPIRMEIGSATERVDVTSQAPPLDTAAASLGRVIDSKRIVGLPQRGGTPVEFELLAPGVINSTNLRIRGAAGPDALSSMSTNGNPDTHNEYQLDGIFDGAADKGSGTSRPGFSPPTGAVREFKIQTAPYDASVGHTVGAVVSVTTASGTNDLHGELHFWARNSAFDAPNFFNNANGSKPGKYRDDYYGFTVGGPVYIPHVYNGKNKTFWLYSWERRYPHTDPNSFLETVPTAAERMGDFSALLALGPQYQIYNPFSTTPLGNGRYQRDPFPNNVIPTKLLDPVGLQLASLYALPNRPGTPDGQSNFFNGSSVNIANYHVNLGRVDHAFSDNHRLFLRLDSDYFIYLKGRDFLPSQVDGQYQPRLNKGLVLDDVLVISPSLVLNLRYGITNTASILWRISRGFDLSSLGFSPALVNSVSDKSQATIPKITIPGFTTISNYDNPGDGKNSSLTHNLAANFTKIQGRHALRFGADLRLDRAFGNRYPLDVSPLISPTNAYTNGPLDNSPGAPIGQELASLLLGIPSGSMTRSASYAVQDFFTGLYFQDDFKVTPKLTLNIGLRYELETPVTERYNRLVGAFDFNATNPIQAAAQSNYASNPIPELPANNFLVRGGLTWVGQGNTGRSPFHMQNNWMPRIGIAYLLTPKTTLRAGYGIYYDSIGVYGFLPIQTGFSQSTPIQPSLDNGVTYVANNANPFPTGLLPPLGPNGGLQTNLGQAISFINPNLKRPYAQRWSGGFQRLLPGQFLMEVSYVGNRGTRLGVTRQLNNTPAQYLSTLPTRDPATINFLSQSFPNPFFGTNPIFGRTITRANLLQPYPEFGAISDIEPIGYSWYHSLQAQAERRFGQGFTLQVGYTFSKFMDATAFLNPTDPMPYRDISTLDRPYRFTASSIYEIPFGRGRRFGTNLWRPADFILGGWQLTGIAVRQAGAPLTFGDVIFNGNIKDIPLPKDQRKPAEWFNVNAGFNRNSAQQRSFDIRTFPFRLSGVRANGQADYDFNIQKDFSLRERAKVQFRAEVFNAWNHANFSAPNTNPTSQLFGVITSTDSDPRNWQLGMQVIF